MSLKFKMSRTFQIGAILLYAGWYFTVDAIFFSGLHHFSISSLLFAFGGWTLTLPFHIGFQILGRKVMRRGDEQRLLRESLLLNIPVFLFAVIAICFDFPSQKKQEEALEYFIAKENIDAFSITDYGRLRGFGEITMIVVETEIPQKDLASVLKGEGYSIETTNGTEYEINAVREWIKRDTGVSMKLRAPFLHYMLHQNGSTKHVFFGLNQSNVYFWLSPGNLAGI